MAFNFNPLVVGFGAMQSNPLAGLDLSFWGLGASVPNPLMAVTNAAQKKTAVATHWCHIGASVSNPLMAHAAHGTLVGNPIHGYAGGPSLEEPLQKIEVRTSFVERVPRGPIHPWFLNRKKNRRLRHETFSSPTDPALPKKVQTTQGQTRLFSL